MLPDVHVRQFSWKLYAIADPGEKTMSRCNVSPGRSKPNPSPLGTSIALCMLTKPNFCGSADIFVIFTGTDTDCETKHWPKFNTGGSKRISELVNCARRVKVTGSLDNTGCAYMGRGIIQGQDER